MPRRLRFRYAYLLARLFRPLIARILAPQYGLGELNSDIVLALGYVLRAMTEQGCEFDLPLRVHGEEAIPGGAAIYVSGHLYLAVVVVPYLSDRGVPLTIVRPTSDVQRMIGRCQPIPTLASLDKLLFVRIRNAIRRGTSVAALLDDASTGKIVIRRPAIEVALRAQIPIVFFGAALSRDGAIDLMFRRPRGGDVDAIAAELLAFVRSQRDV